MEDAYNHLLVNHLPVFATLFGVLLLAAGAVANNAHWARAGLVALVAAAVLTVPAYLTGEGAEEFVEDLPGASHKAVHQHEDAAGLAQIFSYVLGAFALGALVAGKRVAQRTYWAIIVVLGLVTFGSMAYTAKLGGEIRRPELRGESVQPTNESQQEKEATEQDD